MFSGTIVTTGDTSLSEYSPVDLADVVGYVIYDKQLDGALDDTVVFYGEERGAFSGLLLYETPANITAPWLRKHVRLLFPELGVDTFLTVDVYRADAETPDEVNRWDTLKLRSSG